jgi:hypothetical protein
MAESVFDWSTTAANNDDADSGINWSESQLPSTVNNSARGMMAAIAKFRDIVVNEAFYEYATYDTISGAGETIPADDTIPQITEGVQIFSQSITLSATTSKVSIRVSVPVAHATAGEAFTVAVFRGATASAVAAKIVAAPGNDYIYELFLEDLDSPSTAGSVTYSVRIGVSSGTGYVNGNSIGRRLGGVLKATLSLREVRAS